MYQNAEELQKENFQLKCTLRLIAELGDNMKLTNAQSVEYMTDIALHALGDTRDTSFFLEYGYELDGFIEELSDRAKMDDCLLRRIILKPE